ncbi:MAG TPA: hypothetical protein PK156_06570 [Polyangium sp.]|nr:hypothetical protein [Polyangium sp.]
MRTESPTPLPLPDLEQWLAAPSGELKLLAGTSGCFHREAHEVNLMWSTESTILRVAGNEVILDSEQRASLLRHLIRAATLPAYPPQFVSTTVTTCMLRWSCPTFATADREGERTWSSSVGFTLPEMPTPPPDPTDELYSIACDPMKFVAKS